MLLNDCLPGLNFDHTFTFDNDLLASTIRPLLSADTEMSFECEVDGQLLSKLIGVDLSDRPDISCATMLFNSPYSVQIRRHKKKRIDKKWNKRFGPKYVIKFKSFQLEDVIINQNESSFDIVGERLKWVY